MTSKIWVDADACPVVIREILVRAATRTQTPMTLLANPAIRVPNSPYIQCIQVASGFDVADNGICRRCEKGDLVITSDIPLADEVITKGAEVLSSRGEPYTKDNIKQRLNMRDFMDTMRGSGVHSGGPPPLGNQEKQRFANALDRWLAKRIR